jgi:fructose-1,6-bisphosphatase I
MSGATLDAYLGSHTSRGGDLPQAVALLVRHLAVAACALHKTIDEGLTDVEGLTSASHNASGDAQHALDIHADQLFLEAARKANVAFYASEEQPSVMTLAPGGRLALAVDPLDGSSNVDINLSIGTIFSIQPALADKEASFLQKGSSQLAAGIFVYGPQLALVLTLGHGTTIFTFSRHIGTFVETRPGVIVPERTTNFAINMSNYRHWDESVRAYIDDCIKGSEGARGTDFNMRWIASMVADVYRILVKGGIYLYPADARQGYGHGRLRLVYEANPVAMLMEQAGGCATDGAQRILDLVPEDIHEHVPLVFGSSYEVAKAARYLAAPSEIGLRHPLFGRRGLFNA